MRDYGRVYSAFWTSPDMRALSDDARLLALYLLSGPHTTIAGICRLPDGYICEDLEWTPGRVSKGLGELFRNGFANRCETTKWVWICKFLTWNHPENPNQWKAAKKIVATIPAQCAWKASFLRAFAIACGDPDPGPEEPFPNRSETLSKGLPTQEQDQKQEQKQEQEQDQYLSSAKPLDPVAQVFEHWRSTWNHPKAALDAKRRAVIQRALKHYAPEVLCESISGYRNSPHHTGQNDRNTVYDGLELFLRDSAHVDAGLRFASSPPVMASERTIKNVSVLSNWKPPEARDETVRPGEISDRDGESFGAIRQRTLPAAG